MKKAATILGILIGASTLACSTLTTAVDYDHTVNWSQFHTFQLVEGTKDPVTFTQKRIEDAITSQLTSKGWQPVTSNPDILVYTHTVLSHQKQWNATSMGGGGWGYRGWGGMGGTATATETNIPIGNLVVDLVNPKTKELVWRGQASDQVSGSGEDKGKVDAAVAALFKNFPPAPGQS
jgi:Domain of unknown function (DUF4136)